MKSKIFFTIILFLFSLLYLEKAINFIQKNDFLMQEIKRFSFKEEKAIDAIITIRTMIPGKSGKKLNLKASYQKMQKMQTFNESLLVFEDILPKKSIKNIFDKIILSGNKKNNKVSIILNIDNDQMFTLLNTTLNNNNIYGDILVKKEYHLENTNYKNIVTRDYHSFTNYCITIDLTINNSCINNKIATILGKSIHNYYLHNTQKVIENGTILLYSFNENNYNELNIIIKYLKNNNYEIVPINELIKE